MRTDLSGVVTAPEAVHDVYRWITEFVMEPHELLGRKGAVCPFMDSAMRTGRVLVNPIWIWDPERAGRTGTLRSAAETWLSRIRNAADGDDFEAVLFVPFGPNEDTLRAVVNKVQQDLRPSVLRQGCMIGVFYPGHPEPGIHGAALRPLSSPRAILGIRTMVDTDILFLTASGTRPADRVHDIGVWQGFFGTRAPRALLEMARRSLAEAEHVAATTD